MDNPLGVRLPGLPFGPGTLCRGTAGFQIKYKVLAHPANARNAPGFERGGNLFRGRFEGFGFRSQPDRFDVVSGDAPVQSVGYGFDFGEFWHAATSLQSSAVRRQQQRQPPRLPVDRGAMYDLEYTSAPLIPVIQQSR